MHKYKNSTYGFTAVKTTFTPYAEPEQKEVYDYGEKQGYDQPQQPQKRKYLPGERLLRKLNKQQQVPLNMKIIEKSISEILDSL